MPLDLDKILLEVSRFQKLRDEGDSIDFINACKHYDSIKVIRELVEEVKKLEAIKIYMERLNKVYEHDSFTAEKRKLPSEIVMAIKDISDKLKS